MASVALNLLPHHPNRANGESTPHSNNPKDVGSLSSNEVAHIYQDKKGVVWVSTFRGLNRFDSKAGKFIRYQHDAGNSASLSDDYVTAVSEDRCRSRWLLTEAKAVLTRE